MKRAIFVLAIAAVFVLAFTGSAFANFGPHGGYSLDTDACAGCHRAHTSFSSVTWTDQASNSHSALLVSSATTMEEFCYACHGAAAPGASTNVQQGIFDSGPSAAAGVAAGTVVGGVTTMYETNSSFNATLNGGGFDQVGGAGVSTSMHNMEDGVATDPMWGAGSSAPAGANLTCTSCHDPHGSTNYRLLKDSVNGHTVGGYVNDVPQPWVFSSESGYPTGGWLKHEPGASQMTTYFPNYTSPQYAWKAAGTIASDGYVTSDFRSMSSWCVACHEAYDDKTSAYDYGTYEQASGQLVGSRTRHRHPVDISLMAGVGPTRALAMEVVTSTVLPLEDGPDVGTTATDFTDMLGCLTCHFAHGTDATMTGWANSQLTNNASRVPSWSVELRTAQPGGVNPNFSSSLLRADNRGVCERCHNK